MIIAEIFDMKVYLTEGEHSRIVSYRRNDFRPLYLRREIFDPIYNREAGRDRSYGLPPRITFREWMVSAYERHSYHQYKRYQVVKIFYQLSDKHTRKSPLPFADVRAWHSVLMEGSEVDEESEAECSGEHVDELTKETHYLTALFMSLIEALYQNTIDETSINTECEQVEDDEAEDVCEIKRAGLFYEHIKEFFVMSEEEISEFNAEELRERTGVYLEDTVRKIEREMKPVFEMYFGYFSKREIARMVKNGEWYSLYMMYSLYRLGKISGR